MDADTALSVLTWSCLPTEIRHLILHLLAKESSRLSRYASVCREWQSVIETINFSQLRVTASCLSQLDMFARSRRAMLRCIKFRILLQEYDCSQCDLLPDSDWIDRDQDIVDHALRALMLTLAVWEPCSSSLTVDISIHSPSDAKHHYQNFILENNDCSDEMQSIVPKDDIRHGWKGNRQVSFPPERSLCRVFGLIEPTEDFWVNLPQVKTVTCLQFRRQTRRQWCQRSLQRLIPYFHGLEITYYEPWRQRIPRYIDEADEYNVRLFETFAECPLRHIVIFEDFDDYYVKDRPLLHIQCDPVVTRKANTAVSNALARASLGLQSLSASFIVDASQFFAACQSTWVWDRLTSLALSSRNLTPKDVDFVKTNNMLQIVASVAVKMPNLHTMALWNYNRKFVGTFLYQTLVEQRLAKVTWRATWNVELTPPVVRLWEAVALGHDMLGLIIVKETLDSKAACKSHGHAVEHLRIPCQVLHPDSVLQIQQEFHNYRIGTDLR